MTEPELLHVTSFDSLGDINTLQTGNTVTFSVAKCPDPHGYYSTFKEAKEELMRQARQDSPLDISRGKWAINFGPACPKEMIKTILSQITDVSTQERERLLQGHCQAMRVRDGEQQSLLPYPYTQGLLNELFYPEYKIINWFDIVNPNK